MSETIKIPCRSCGGYPERVKFMLTDCGCFAATQLFRECKTDLFEHYWKIRNEKHNPFFQCQHTFEEWSEFATDNFSWLSCQKCNYSFPAQLKQNIQLAKQYHQKECFHEWKPDGLNLDKDLFFDVCVHCGISRPHHEKV